MASVNLWELITTVASHRYSRQTGVEPYGLPNAEKCQDIQGIIGPRFGSELSLDIDRNVWTVKIFDHECSYDRFVEISVAADGSVSVTRCRVQDGVRDERTISF